MDDLNCILAGLTRLLGPLVMLILWHKRSHAKLLPAPVALAACLPVFMLGNAIRSGFDYSSPLFYCIQQGLLFGILEEGLKYLMLRFALSDYDTREDAVTYGIGHGAYEEIGMAVNCFALVGKGTADTAIFVMAVLSVIESALSVSAKTLMILYGIREGKAGRMLLLAIILHAVGNMSMHIFVDFVSIIIVFILTAAEMCIACRCWKAMRIPLKSDDRNETKHQL